MIERPVLPKLAVQLHAIQATMGRRMALEQEYHQRYIVYYKARRMLKPLRKKYCQ